MYSSELIKKIVQRFPETSEIPVPEKYVRDPEPHLRVPAQKLREISKYLKTDPEYLFDLPIHMTAVDYIKENVFELVYALYSTKKRQGIVVKVQIPRNSAEVDTVSDIWAGMDWQEREVFDLFGISFRGHKYLKRIMLWEGYPGHPLRKDYVHVTDKYDSGLEVGTPGLDAKGVPVGQGGAAHGAGETK
jgi:NADH:ubiquinone oxidoreductase subunit C